jgi:hypothetical protein
MLVISIKTVNKSVNKSVLSKQSPKSAGNMSKVTRWYLNLTTAGD